MAEEELSSQQEFSPQTAGAAATSRPTLTPVTLPPPDPLIIKDFLDAEFRNDLIREARSCELKQATVNKDKQSIVDTSTRNVKTVAVSQETRALVADRLMSIKHRLEAHFDTELRECQKLVFLFYTEGGFYVPHADASRYHNSSDSILRRKVSVVIFLNSQLDECDAEGYSGGELMMYGSEQECDWEQHSRPVRGEAGSLVAFRSDVVHSVEPVTAGERFTIVTWLA